MEQVQGQYNLIIILGPTASGKTALAARLAADLDSAVISADSRQVYRGMDIGTGKDLQEFVIEGRHVPYHLIDIVDPGREFSVFEYQQRFHDCFLTLLKEGVVPVMVGGTGLYLEAVIEGYQMAEVPPDLLLRRELEMLDMEELKERLRSINPALHNTTDLVHRERVLRAIEIAEHDGESGSGNVSRVPVRPFIVGVRWERDVLRRRITLRLAARLEQGMMDEVRKLHEEGISWERLDLFGLEYRYIGRCLQGMISRDEMVTVLNTRIHQFAKRQTTWFRRMERRGAVIHWIDGDDYATLAELVREAGITGRLG
ncbi:MAG: tRNA (adenosine(37)-N6)-dimethylallyltransferase MiaA [Deltaproteobacteria bacterium]|nr:tRNA (adenosine(37)-N6)-dimethylallyltransferase MiaA [Deltaproteobacteria bacterium]